MADVATVAISEEWKESFFRVRMHLIVFFQCFSSRSIFGTTFVGEVRPPVPPQSGSERTHSGPRD